jgi:transcriptional regulator with XRE-family HTH domain
LSRGEYNRNVGAWIRSQRTLLGLSQIALAAAINVSPSSIVCWEAGRGTMLAYSRSQLGKFFKDEAQRRKLQLDAMPESEDMPALPVDDRPSTAGGKHAQ